MLHISLRGAVAGSVHLGLCLDSGRISKPDIKNVNVDKVLELHLQAVESKLDLVYHLK